MIVVDIAELLDWPLRYIFFIHLFSKGVSEMEPEEIMKHAVISSETPKATSEEVFRLDWSPAKIIIFSLSLYVLFWVVVLSALR